MLPDEIDAKRITEAQLKIPFPETFTYSNCVAMGTSFMDLRIGFGEVIGEKAEARVGVVMPVEAAAVLMINLMGQLSAFEANFGEIRHPLWKAYRTGIHSLQQSLTSAVPTEEKEI